MDPPSAPCSADILLLVILGNRVNLGIRLDWFLGIKLLPCYAGYTGTAPVEASSGDVRRHRLNRGGNRQLNTALHLVAVCQIRDPSPGQGHYRRKLAEAKTPEKGRTRGR
jgi:Transposase IS116/IS110/IS902 family